MSEITEAAPSKAKKPTGSLFIDLGPVLLFMVAYNIAHRTHPDEAIYIGTAVFMAATLVALAYAFFVQKRVPPMLIITAFIVGIFGGLTIYLHNPTFVKMKPTVIYLLFATAILGGLLFKQNVLSLLFAGTFEMEQKAKNTLALRYGLLFVFLAIVNEIIWRNFPEDVWVNTKLPVTFGAIVIFSLLNISFFKKHLKEEGETPSAS